MQRDLFDEHVRTERWVERTRAIGTWIVVLLAVLTALGTATLWKLTQSQEQTAAVLAQTTVLLDVTRLAEGHLKKIAGAFPLPTTRPMVTHAYVATRSFARGEHLRCDDPRNPGKVVACDYQSWGWTPQSPESGDLGQLQKTLSGYPAFTIFVITGHDDERMSPVTAGKYDSNFNLAFRRGEAMRDQLRKTFGILADRVRWIVVPQGAVMPGSARVANRESRKAARVPSFVVVAG